MSKRKLYDDDVYVQSYTKRYGRYKYIRAHYRRHPNRRKAQSEIDPVSIELFFWALAVICPFWSIPLLIDKIRERKYFSVLIYFIYAAFWTAALVAL